MNTQCIGLKIAHDLKTVQCTDGGNLPSEKMKYGLTGGCFDWLHIGHERLLSILLDNCEIPIVILHDDESIHKLKKTEKIQIMQQRKKVIELFSKHVIVVQGVDCRPNVNSYIQNHFPDLSKTNTIFIRGDDNKNFPNRSYFETFSNIYLIPYDERISSTIVRKNDEIVLIHKLFKDISNKPDYSFAITGQQSQDIFEGRMIQFPLKLNVARTSDSIIWTLYFGILVPIYSLPFNEKIKIINK